MYQFILQLDFSTEPLTEANLRDCSRKANDTFTPTDHVLFKIRNDL